jgi:ATP-dependent helicase HrpB
MVAQALLNRVLDEGIASLNWNEASDAYRARIAFAARHLPDEPWPDLSDKALSATAEQWLLPLLEQAGSMPALKPDMLDNALHGMLPWDQQRRLDELAPARFDTPAGTSHLIDYTADNGPLVEVRVQALFGLRTHPTIARGRIALTLALTSPAQRPIQVTRDLPGFWSGSWREVKVEMKGRYPRHPWPDDPANAAPTTRAKPRGT